MLSYKIELFLEWLSIFTSTGNNEYCQVLSSKKAEWENIQSIDDFEAFLKDSEGFWMIPEEENTQKCTWMYWPSNKPLY